VSDRYLVQRTRRETAMLALTICQPYEALIPKGAKTCPLLQVVTEG